MEGNSDSPTIQGGFIILARAFFDNKVWRCLPSRHIVVALRCIDLAYWTPGKFYDGATTLTIGRGQFPFTQNGLAERCPKDVTRKVVRDALKNLTNPDFGFLDVEAGHHFSVGTICNYEHYADLARYMGQARAKQGPSKGQPFIIEKTGIQEDREVFLAWAFEVVNGWNGLVADARTFGLSKVIWDDTALGDPDRWPLADGRLRNLAARRREPLFVDNLPVLLERIATSDLCSGRKAKFRTRGSGGKYGNWKASFDWFIGNDRNYRALLEGKFADLADAGRAVGLKPTAGKYAGLTYKGASDEINPEGDAEGGPAPGCRTA